MAERPILLLTGTLAAAGFIYLLTVRWIGNTRHSKGLMVWMLGVGAVIRIVLMPSTSMLEDDFYRYMWDGALTAWGRNPYSYAPKEAVLQKGNPESVPFLHRKLGMESGNVIHRVNHPELRTIYPPVAQGFFALAYVIRPWSLVAWRGVLFGCDVLVLGLIVVLLRQSKLPLLWSAVYWWNPLLVKETFNSGHMDVVVLPFVLASVLLSTRGRHICAVCALALAMGAKVWPIVLLPLVLRPLLSMPIRLMVAVVTFAVLACALVFPVYVGGLDPESGFLAYGKRWEMNDALFMLFLWGSEFCLKFVGNPEHAPLISRTVVLSIVMAWTLWLSRRRVTGSVDLCNRMLLVIAALFLLSPTQFPWYSIWMLPFLAVKPRMSLLLLTVLLPLYYMRFYFAARNSAGVFDNGIVWLEYAPVWILIVWECYKSRRSRSDVMLEAAT